MVSIIIYTKEIGSWGILEMESIINQTKEIESW
jgi:carbonic anhydrase/acetyltransferase-like protein (isoleucine patch superfamily)